MSLELANYYEHTARKDHHFTHLLQAKLPSMGERHGCRIPDLLLTIQYKLDAKGNVLRQPEPKFVFQTDGPTKAQLNFRHHTLQIEHVFSVCRFYVSMDAVFGEGIVDNSAHTVEVNVGLGGENSPAKGGGGYEYTNGTSQPGGLTYLHARIEGLLVTKEKRIDVWGQIV